MTAWYRNSSNSSFNVSQYHKESHETILDLEMKKEYMLKIEHEDEQKQAYE